MNTEKLKPGDIIFWKNGTDIWVYIIKWLTKSQYHHVGVVVNNSIGIDAYSPIPLSAAVRAIDLRTLKEEDVDIFRVNQDFNQNKLMSFLISKLGAKLDILGMIWLMFLKIYSLLTGLKYKPFNKFQRDKDYFCSELVCEAFKHAGVIIVDSPEVSSPKDMLNSGKLFRI